MKEEFIAYMKVLYLRGGKPRKACQHSKS